MVKLSYFHHSIILYRKLEKDRLLNKYRSRYQSLSSQVSRTKPGSKSNQIHKYYRKECPIIKDKYKKGKITGKKFEEWIDSTKLKNAK